MSHLVENISFSKLYGRNSPAIFAHQDVVDDVIRVIGVFPLSNVNTQLSIHHGSIEQVFYTRLYLLYLLFI